MYGPSRMLCCCNIGQFFMYGSSWMLCCCHIEPAFLCMGHQGCCVAVILSQLFYVWAIKDVVLL